MKWRNILEEVLRREGGKVTGHRLLELITPEYEEYEAFIRRSLVYMRRYAAALSVECSEPDLIAQLRARTKLLADFWLGNENPAITQEYITEFDQEIETAKATGHSPEFTRQMAKVILEGLQLTIDEADFSGCSKSMIQECRQLYTALDDMWEINEQHGFEVMRL